MFYLEMLCRWEERLSLKRANDVWGSDEMQSTYIR